MAVLPPAELPQQVRQADADMGLTFSRQPERDIRVEYRQPAPLLAVMRPDHPLAKKSRLTVNDLARSKFILYEQRMNFRALSLLMQRISATRSVLRYCVISRHPASLSSQACRTGKQPPF